MKVNEINSVSFDRFIRDEICIFVAKIANI